METNKSYTKRQAFVVTPNELQRIATILPEDTELILEIMCRDGIERKYWSVDEFLKFEHSPDKQIKELSLSSLSSSIMSKPINQILLFVIVMAIGLIVGSLLFGLMQRFVNYAFPMGVFAIGQGIQRHQNRERLRTIVILGFLINIVAGIFVWILIK